MKLRYQALNAGILVAVLALGIAPAYGNQVAYSFSLRTLASCNICAFDFRGGGILYADGTAAGDILLSVPPSGTIIFRFIPETWTFVPESAVPGLPGADICGDFVPIKGEIPPDAVTCSGSIPISGTPLILDLDMNGADDYLVRVSPLN